MHKQLQTLQWGILGLGKIAHSFCKDLQLVENTAIAAVASRNAAKAEEFAAQYGVKKHYGSYNELFEAPNVDIVYIATPHDSHLQWTMAALNAQKHILCEKPMGVNRMQVEKMIEAAQKNGVFLMEALWSKFNPTIKTCVELAKSGTAIGRVNRLYADFNFKVDAPDTSRLFNPDLAGGALLDVGIYPIFLAYCIFGKPKEILATTRFHRTGADLQTSAILKYENATANISCGFDSQSDMQAKIYGTKGQITIESRWHEASAYTIHNPKKGTSQSFSLPKKGKGYTYEIEECIRCIAAGKLQSDDWSHQNSLDLIQILDEIRGQIGLKYPFECFD